MANSNRKRLFTPEQEAEIRRLYEQGLSTTDLGKQFHTSSRTIWFIIRRAGGSLRTKSEALKLKLGHNDGLTNSRREYLRCRELGICHQCRKNPAALADTATGPGHKLTPHKTKYVSMCEECRIKHRLATQERTKRGLCRTCCKPNSSSCATCEACRTRAREKYQQIKAEVFAAYGGFLCSCCGETEPVFLAIDHIDGGGNAARRRGEGVGAPFYQRLRRLGFPPGFGVLCHNCNFAKHVLGECPHQRLKRERERQSATEATPAE